MVKLATLGCSVLNSYMKGERFVIVSMPHLLRWILFSQLTMWIPDGFPSMLNIFLHALHALPISILFNCKVFKQVIFLFCIQHVTYISVHWGVPTGQIWVILIRPLREQNWSRSYIYHYIHVQCYTILAHNLCCYLLVTQGCTGEHNHFLFSFEQIE